jgi:hypothetical protein
MKRVDWAKLHLNQDWTRVIFSDETIFQLQSSRVRVWGRERKFCYRSRNPPKVDIWGAISHAGTVGLFMFPEKQTITSDVYIESILADTLLPHAHAIFGIEFIFQQDNACSFCSRNSAMVRGFQVEKLPWPAQSPDANPIENIWSWMEVEIERKKPTNLTNLKAAIVDIWNSLTPEFLQRYTSSMQRRCEAIIDADGATIAY